MSATSEIYKIGSNITFIESDDPVRVNDVHFAVKDIWSVDDLVNAADLEWQKLESTRQNRAQANSEDGTKVEKEHSILRAETVNIRGTINEFRGVVYTLLQRGGMIFNTGEIYPYQIVEDFADKCAVKPTNFLSTLNNSGMIMGYTVSDLISAINISSEIRLHPSAVQYFNKGTSAYNLTPNMIGKYTVKMLETRSQARPIDSLIGFKQGDGLVKSGQRRASILDNRLILPLGEHLKTKFGGQHAPVLRFLPETKAIARMVVYEILSGRATYEARVLYQNTTTRYN